MAVGSFLFEWQKKPCWDSKAKCRLCLNCSYKCPKLPSVNHYLGVNNRTEKWPVTHVHIWNYFMFKPVHPFIARAKDQLIKLQLWATPRSSATQTAPVWAEQPPVQWWTTPRSVSASRFFFYINALLEEKPWKQRPEIWADQVEARLWLVLTLMLRGILAVIGWRCILSFVVHACCWIYSWFATRV